MRAPCLRMLYRVAWLGLWAHSRVVPSHGRGVKCVLTRGEEVLMVRHTYGVRRRWELPGGGIHRREEAEAAARRELREELGLEGLDLTPLGVVRARQGRRRVTLHCYIAEIAEGATLRLDPVEIAAAAWHPLSMLASRLPPYGAPIVDALQASRGAREQAGAL